MRGVFVFLFAAVCCNSADATPTPTPPDGPPIEGAPPGPDGGGSSGDGGPDAARNGPPPGPANLRVMAANISSGARTDYGSIEGVRIFEGLHPDVVLIQELNVGGNTKAEIDAYVSTVFGTTFTYFREEGAGFQIPNGIISRYPIIESGSWADPGAANRGFAYAKLAVLGPRPLWAISLHLLTTGAAQRTAEVTELVAKVKAVVPSADYLIVGGDLNTASRGEDCVVNGVTGLAAIVGIGAPYPADGAGNTNTSTPRSKPHDWLLSDADLAPLSVPVTIGAQSFAAGLVFDSRAYTPLADVAPVEASDSSSLNMQHMPVVRDFHLSP